MFKIEKDNFISVKYNEVKYKTKLEEFSFENEKIKLDSIDIKNCKFDGIVFDKVDIKFCNIEDTTFINCDLNNIIISDCMLLAVQGTLKSLLQHHSSKA